MSEFFVVMEGLLLDWLIIDFFFNDGVGWVVCNNDLLCFSGGYCFYLVWSEFSVFGVVYCNIYYNGDMEDCVFVEEVGSNFVMVVNLYLGSK